MNTKHTPGPWEARPDTNACLPDDWCVGTGPQNIDKVAVCSKCDAHLIAAAPRMAAALQRAAHMLAELPEQSPQTLAMRTEIVDCIKQATPDYYGIKIEGGAA
jgi:hypothetical protein